MPVVMFVLLLAGATAVPAAAQAEGSVSAPPRQSWTADRRSFVTGDVLTVLIDEYTIANQQTGTMAERSRSQTADAAVRAGSAVPGGSAAAGTSARGDSRERGEARRQTSFAGEMAVRVVEIGTDGMLRIEGTKRIVVDKGTQEVALTGWIRPQDVSGRNVIESWRVADLALQHVSSGTLGQPRRGFFGRIIDLIWP
jgi:flagellar L-ring protein FlgH